MGRLHIGDKVVTPILLTGGDKIKNQNKNITQNGAYSFDEGYTGLGIVNVDVPIANAATAELVMNTDRTTIKKLLVNNLPPYEFDIHDLYSSFFIITDFKATNILDPYVGPSYKIPYPTVLFKSGGFIIQFGYYGTTGGRFGPYICGSLIFDNGQQINIFTYNSEYWLQNNTRYQIIFRKDYNKIEILYKNMDLLDSQWVTVISYDVSNLPDSPIKLDNKITVGGTEDSNLYNLVGSLYIGDGNRFYCYNSSTSQYAINWRSNKPCLT